MSKSLSIVMILVIMSPNLMKIGVWIDFKINEDFVSKVLCINKNKPMLHCNGQCILAQQLQKAEEQDDQQLPTSKTQKLDEVYCNPYDKSENVRANKQHDRHTSHLGWVNTCYHFAFTADIFQPPATTWQLPLSSSLQQSAAS